MNYILFWFVILLANIFQGITGFAGTILAMSPSILIVGYDTAKPVLNILGIFSGLYVVLKDYKSIHWKELRTIVCYMGIGILGGFWLKNYTSVNQELLYMVFIAFVVVISVKGLIGLYTNVKPRSSNRYLAYVILAFAGVIHSIFVSGGPLLISYLSDKVKDKKDFRATISMVWIIINGAILVGDLSVGLATIQSFKISLCVAPALFAGLFIGTKLYERLSQVLFLKITYLLLFVMAVIMMF